MASSPQKASCIGLALTTASLSGRGSLTGQPSSAANLRCALMTSWSSRSRVSSTSLSPKMWSKARETQQSRRLKSQIPLWPLPERAGKRNPTTLRFWRVPPATTATMTSQSLAKKRQSSNKMTRSLFKRKLSWSR